MRKARILWFCIMVGPATLGFLALTLGPMLASLYLSFTKYEVIAPPQFIGLQNYVYLMTVDPAFWPSVRVTALYVLLTVPLSLVVALTVALLLNQPLRMRGFFRTVFFLPSLLPATASAIVWIYIFHPHYGLLNQLLHKVGIEGPAWTSSTTWAMPCIVIMSAWGFGGAMVVFLAGLQGVPRTLYEAAQLDGADRIRQFLHVTLPMISPILFFNLVMGLIGAMKIFDQAYVFGTAGSESIVLGGPARATLFYVLNLYQKSFNYFHMGLGCAMAWMFFLVIVALTYLNFWFGRKWVHYG